MPKTIYLDYAATTPVAPEVATRMAQCLTLEGTFANPASRAHLLGWQAEEVVEDARGQVAQLLRADPREVIFTSGATESNNLAIKGVALARQHSHQQPPGLGHIVTSAIEHKAVLDTCKWLETQGFEVSYIKPAADGTVSAQVLAQALRPDTVLVSIMHVNNELGSINHIAQLGELCRARHIAFHVDAAQSAGKLPLDMAAMNVDLMSLSAHKMYGPKGVGALYVRRCEDIQVLPQVHGGGHERGLRAGTLATHQLVGLGQAAKLAMQLMASDQAHLEALRRRFWRGINHLPGVTVNGVYESLFPGILNVNFGAVDGEMLLIALPGIAVSTGSACTSASLEPSYVLKQLGVADAEAHGSLRFSFGRYTTVKDIDNAVSIVCTGVQQLHAKGSGPSAL